MDLLLLTAPAQHGTSNPAVILHEKRLQEWFDALPTMNVINTVQMLQQAITTFNELELDTSERFRLLEVYRRYFDEILFSYDELRLRSLPISVEQRKKIAEDIMWLYLELANGYKIIIKNEHEVGQTPKRNTALLISIYRAMELIMFAMVYAHKAHTEIAPLAHFELKQLFHYAENYAVTDSRVKSIRDHITTPTIRNLLNQYLLFTALRPQQLNSEDILELFVLLEKYSPTVIAASTDTPANPRNIIKLDLNTDMPPLTCQTTLQAECTEPYCCFDLSPAINEIDTSYQSLAKSERSFLQQRDEQLLAICLKQLSGITTAASRRPQQRTVSLVTGIKDILYFLQNEERFTTLFEVKDNFGIEVHEELSPEDVLPAFSDWIVIDENQAARVLLAQNSEGMQVPQQDSIVGLIETVGEDKHPVLIAGVVRRVKVDETNTKLGIELLPGLPIPFSYSLLTTSPTNSVYGHGLFFSDIPALKRPATLLVAKPHYVENSAWQVEIRNKQYQVQSVMRVLEVTDYVQFAFNVVQ